MEGRNTKCMNIAQFFFEIHDAEVEFIRKYPTEDSELQVRRTDKMSFFFFDHVNPAPDQQGSSKPYCKLAECRNKKQIADTETEDGWIQRLLNYWKTSSKNMIQ